MSDTTTYTGVFASYRWRSHESLGETPYIVGHLEDGTCVQGSCEEGGLLPGVLYEFFASGSNKGWQDHPQHGRSFKFTMFAVKVPHTREGVVGYLQKHGVRIGPVTALRIWDVFGADSVKVLRTQPGVVAAHPDIPLSLENATKSAHALTLVAALEDTKIGLLGMFAGRGFPAVLVEECLKLWQIQAVARIRRDPYTLLVHGLSGCGFARCDKMYTDFGLPPARLKRQVICVWHILRSDGSGDTWTRAEYVVERLGEVISQAKIKAKKAIRLGLRARWIAKYRDADGVLWLAEWERARSEAFVAAKLKQLGGWQPADNVAVRSLIAAADAQEMAVA